MMYPEGGCTNGTGLLNFKKGAFHTMRPITPIVMKYKFSSFDATYTMDMLPVIIMHLSQLTCHSVEISLMDDFYPNDYLL